MATISFEVPDEAMRAVAETPEAFARAVRPAAAMFWYGRAEVSIGMAAALAGMSLTAFMHALKEAGQDAFVFDPEEFERELAFLETRRSGATADG